MLQNVTLEMSLKPFRKTDSASVDAVCRKVFEQWKPLVRDVPCVSVMMWSADGSELLDYRGNPDDTFSWAKYIGGANNRETSHAAIDPDNLGLHSRCYLFCEDPPEMTYRILGQIVSSLKRIGKEVLGEDKVIRVGTTFDPGQEFAKSAFKYSRHNEICMGNDMGRATMVCSYARLKGDNTPYAAFPDGIPEGLPFGTFFGAQSEKFLKDLGFDYIWFSNGLGFGRETWAATGAIFDGEAFHGENCLKCGRMWWISGSIFVGNARISPLKPEEPICPWGSISPQTVFPCVPYMTEITAFCPRPTLPGQQSTEISVWN